MGRTKGVVHSSLIERNSQIVEMYLSGKSTYVIARDLRLSNQRIGQILKDYGCAINDIKRELRELKEEQRRNQKYQKKYGYTYEEMMIIISRDDPRRAFRQQRRNAKQRGIPWNFNFKDWWMIWEPHWEKRGRYIGEMVMSRPNDEGPYEIGNVQIITAADNHREYLARRRGKPNPILSPITA